MDHRPFTLNDALRGVISRRRSVAVFFVATVLVIGVATIVSPKTYKSESRLFMRLGRENTSMDATATLGEHPVVMMPQSREAEINSIVEMMQSKQLYEKVVEEIGADRILDRNWKPAEEGGPTPPSFLSSVLGSVLSSLAQMGILNDLPQSERAVIRLQKHMEIEAFEKSNVLAISYKSYSPELAREVVDRLVVHYKKQHGSLHRAPHALAFMEEETENTEQQLVQARKELEAFKVQTGILESAQQRTVLIDRLAQLQADLLVAESNAAALQTEVTQLDASLQRMSDTTTTALTVGAGNQGVDGMRQKLFDLEVQREQLASKYTSENLRLQELNRQVKEAKAILEAAESGRTESILGPNLVYQQTAVALEQKRPSLAAENAKAEKLREQIAKSQAEFTQFTAYEREFARLDRNVEVLEANFRKYFANLDQARVDSRMKAEEFSNVGIAQPATLNLKPYSPNKLVNACAAVFLGLFGGIGYAVFAEYLKPTASAQSEIALALDSRVIATVPEIGSQDLDPMRQKRHSGVVTHQFDHAVMKGSGDSVGSGSS